MRCVQKKKQWRKPDFISTGSPFRRISVAFAECAIYIFTAYYVSLYAVCALRKKYTSSLTDNGKMNAKWRTQRHLSIRDLDYRSLFLCYSSFRAIDDRIGLSWGAVLSFLFSFFFFFSSSTTVTQRSSIIIGDHAALWTWIISSERSFPIVLLSQKREFIAACDIKRALFAV